MKSFLYLLLVVTFALAVVGCRARRRPVIVVDAGTQEIPVEALDAAD